MPLVVANHSPHPFVGWKRVVVDRIPPFESGKAPDGTLWVYARAAGLSTVHLDVRVTLEPGEQREIDVANSEKAEFKLPPLPPHLLDWFGGVPNIEGVPMAWVGGEVEGACYSARFRWRSGTLLVADMWVRWYPDTPSTATGEIVVSASNPDVPLLSLQVQDDLTLTWGSAYVMVPGKRDGVLMDAGEHLGDGQARSFPFTLHWANRATHAADWNHAKALASHMVVGHGVTKIYPQGNPVWHRQDDAVADSVGDLSTALQRVASYEAGPLGVTKASTVSGAQEDQMFPGCHAMHHGSGQAEARYLTALRQSLRPCHHLEATGDHLDLSNHPQLVFWDARPHWHRGVSPDRLGKPRDPMGNELNGWWGPDVEHALCQTLTLAARLTPSHALQWQLEHWARIYQLQWTTKTGLSTTQPFAARAIGYEGFLAVNLWDALWDRELAEQVRAHWVERFQRVLQPALQSKWRDIWDVRLDDPRLGAGLWWIPWQQSLGAYGLSLAGRMFSVPAAREIGLRSAMRVVEDAWIKQGERWVSKAQMSATDLSLGTADESFNQFGMCMAPATVLASEPNNAKCASIMQQLKADIWNARKWIPPEVV